MVFSTKSQKPVGPCFPDVCGAFSGVFPHQNVDFQLVLVLPTFGERFFAPEGVKNLVRQAPLERGPPSGAPFGAR